MVKISLAYHVNAALELASGRGAGPGAQTWAKRQKHMSAGTHNYILQCFGSGSFCPDPDRTFFPSQDRQKIWILIYEKSTSKKNVLNIFNTVINVLFWSSSYKT